MKRIMAVCIMSSLLLVSLEPLANQPQQPGQPLQPQQPRQPQQQPLPYQPAQPKQPAQPRQPTQPKQPYGSIDPGCIPGNPTHLPQCSQY